MIKQLLMGNTWCSRRTLVLRYFVSVFLFIFLWSAMPNSARAEIRFSDAFPKRANYFLSWSITDAQAEQLAKWDLLILDAEVEYRSPDALYIIRDRNPHITILAYVTSQDIRDDAATHASSSPLRYERWKNIPESWYLHDSTGKRLSWWPGMSLLNISSASPVSDGKQYYEYLAQHVASKILRRGNWDGIFYDNAWEHVTSFAGADVDIDGDRVRDSKEKVNDAWKQGMQLLFARTRELARRQIIIVGNGDSGFTNVNGIMYENFPRLGWSQTLGAYRDFQKGAAKPFYSVVNSNTKNVPAPTDYRAMRFGLASALMGNGFYSFDDGDAHHESLWWYDEYEAFLGAPLVEPYRVDGVSSSSHSSAPINEPGVWRRDFAQGIILVNSTQGTTTVALAGEFEHILGTQDGTANSGKVVTTVTIAPQDGVFLLKKVRHIENTAFSFGTSVQMYTASGKKMRNGFAAQSTLARTNEQIIIADLQGDGTRETIVAGATSVAVYDASQKLLSRFAPYGKKHTKGLTIAVGNVLGDIAREIVTVSRGAGAAEVRIFTLAGEEAHEGFYAFPVETRFVSGASLAVGDLNGDGFDEIVVGAGVGGGPHVRIIDLTALSNGGFFAYDKKARTGVQVAVGDSNGDGKDEVITLAPVAGAQVVRIFQGSGKQVGADWKIASGRPPKGLRIGAADIDKNFRDEIIFMSDSSFTVLGR